MIYKIRSTDVTGWKAFFDLFVCLFFCFFKNSLIGNRIVLLFQEIVRTSFGLFTNKFVIILPVCCLTGDTAIANCIALGTHLQGASSSK